MSAIYSGKKDPSCVPVSECTDWSKFLELPQFYPNMNPHMVNVTRIERILNMDTIAPHERIKRLRDLVGNVKNLIHFIPPKVHICRIFRGDRVYTVALLFSNTGPKKNIPIVFFGISIWKNDGKERMDRRALAYTAIRRMYKHQFYILLPEYLQKREKLVAAAAAGAVEEKANAKEKKNKEFSIKVVAQYVRNCFIRHQVAKKE